MLTSRTQNDIFLVIPEEEREREHANRETFNAQEIVAKAFSVR